MVPLLGAVTLGRGVGTTEQWVGWFPSTTSALESGASLSAVVAAVLGAWVGGQARTHGTESWAEASHLSRGQRMAPVLAFLVSAVAASTALAFSVLMALSFAFGLREVTSPHILLVLPRMLGWVTAWGLVGAWLGTALRRELALPVAALLTYGVYALVAVYGQPLLSPFAVGDGSNWQYVQPTAAALFSRSAFWVVATVALVTGLAGWARSQNAALWALSLSTAAVIWVGDVVAPVPRATEPVCQSGDPELCVERTVSTTLTGYRAAVADLWPTVPKTLRPAAVVSSPDLARGDERTLVVPPLAGHAEPALRIDPVRFASRFGEQLMLSGCLDSEGGASVLGPGQLQLYLWWRIAADLPPDHPAHDLDVDPTSIDPDHARNLSVARELAARTPNAQAAWFTAHAADIRECTSPPLDAP